MNTESTTEGSTGSAPASRSHLRGVVFVIAAFCVLPLLDGIAKFLITDHNVVQIVWARLLFQSVVVIAWLSLTARLRVAGVERPWLLAACVATIWLANFPIIFSFGFLPLADAFALVMTTPFIVTALSAILLKEKVSLRNWLIVAVGFIGALIIIRPGFGVFHWAGVLPIASAALFALYQIGVRKLTARQTPVDILLYASVFPLLATSLLVPFFWSSPTPAEWGLMAVMGAGAGLGHFLLIRALDQAPASLLAPFMYLQLIVSTLFGVVVFGDFPDTMTIFGALVIVAAGLYGMWIASRSARG